MARNTVRSIVFHTLAATALAAPTFGVAQAVDVALSTALAPGPFLPPGSQATLSVMVRNDGPTPLNNFGYGASVGTNHFLVDGAGENIIVFAIASTAPCNFEVESLDAVPGNAIPASASLDFPPLAVGESRTCTVGVLVQDGAVGTFNLIVTADATSPGVTEATPSNNQQTHTLVFSNVAPAPVPATGVLTTLLLALSVAAVAAWSTTPEANVVRSHPRHRHRFRSGQ